MTTNFELGCRLVGQWGIALSRLDNNRARRRNGGISNSDASLERNPRFRKRSKSNHSDTMKVCLPARSFHSTHCAAFVRHLSFLPSRYAPTTLWSTAPARNSIYGQQWTSICPLMCLCRHATPTTPQNSYHASRAHLNPCRDTNKLTPLCASSRLSGGRSRARKRANHPMSRLRPSQPWP